MSTAPSSDHRAHLMHPSYDRRAFLRRAGLATAGAAMVAGMPRPAAAQDPGLEPFLHGVASGDPVADGVILWTRVTPVDAAPVPVTWRVATDADMNQIVREGSTTADPARDHTVKIDVRGLGAGRWYFYEFEALGGRSIVGRTRTAPAGGGDHLRLGVVSCSNYQGGFFNAYARLAERNDLDAIIHLGDYIYEYGNGTDRYGPGAGALSAARDHQPATEMISLGDYRLRHAGYKLDPDLRRLHQLYPWVVTWDDHESTNNAGGTAPRTTSRVVMPAGTALPRATGRCGRRHRSRPIRSGCRSAPMTRPGSTGACASATWPTSW